MKPHFQTLAEAGFTRSFNGGGCYIHTKKLSNGWTLSVCDGNACEIKEGAERVHLNACRTDNCEVFTAGEWIVGEHLAVALAVYEKLTGTFHLNQDLR